jgi:rod shape-determining protein MreB
VAIKKETHEVMAVGAEAKRMIGRTPGNIIAIRPMKDGVIADFGTTREMISYFIRRARAYRPNFLRMRPRVSIAVPTGITEVERRAVEESAQQAGAYKIELIEEPMAAAIGAGLPVHEPAGSMIIDVGGGTTEIAIISLGGIVVSKSERIAGDRMDDAIVQYIKRKYNLLIGERTAEDIKIKIGSADALPEETSMKIKGRDMVAGMPRTLDITSEEIREAMAEPVTAIIDAVRATLEHTPPELAADIVDSGVVLAGGGAQLRGLDRVLRAETGLNVRLADNPETAIVLGTGKNLEFGSLQSRNGLKSYR